MKPMQGSSHRPLVVQYLYLHGEGESFYYPSVRSASSAERVAVRYLECALTQAATLRLQRAPCDLALATNIARRELLGSSGTKLIERLESLGVAILPTEYRHRPGDDSTTYISSRYVLDAILSATEGQPPDRPLWLTDLDCVWIDADRVFAAAPAPGEVGCIHLTYPPDWDVVGFGPVGLTPRAIGDLAAEMGGPGEVPPWVGGELLSGTAESLSKLVAVCAALDAELQGSGRVLPTEEQLLTLAGALGRVRFRDLSSVASRIQTGPRHEAPATVKPTELGLWHLPSEKGLSLRRTAREVLSGRTGRLRRDLSDPARAARRFNVEGTGLARRIRDDMWILTNKALDRGPRAASG